MSLNFFVNFSKWRFLLINVFNLLRNLSLESLSVFFVKNAIIFDKAYVSYVMFKEWGDKINWITRLRQTASFVVQTSFTVKTKLTFSFVIWPFWVYNGDKQFRTTVILAGYRFWQLWNSLTGRNGRITNTGCQIRYPVKMAGRLTGPKWKFS